MFGSTGGGVVNTGDNSLASDFSREGLGNIDTDEVDPIAEAEVYLAYGRDAQAEEILKDALKKDPQRQEIYLKLLEIHAQHNKPSAFETVASELYAVTQRPGRDLAEGRRARPPARSEQSDVRRRRRAGRAPGARRCRSRAVDGDDSAARRRGDRQALDFQMDEEISISPSSGAKPKSPADILAGAEAELEKTAKPHAADGLRSRPRRRWRRRAGDRRRAGCRQAAPQSTRGASPTRSKPRREARRADEVRPRLQARRRREARADRQAARRARAGDRRTPHGAAARACAPQLTRPAAALELDKLDLSFDPERTTFEDPTPSVLDGQWHDAATKLDLAKAYQEMGDVEGAREILQEVLHEGDDQQKAEAKTLLAKLG